jgi:hypothetical protein
MLIYVCVCGRLSKNEIVQYLLNLFIVLLEAFIVPLVEDTQLENPIRYSSNGEHFSISPITQTNISRVWNFVGAQLPA